MRRLNTLLSSSYAAISGAALLFFVILSGFVRVDAKAVEFNKLYQISAADTGRAIWSHGWSRNPDFNSLTEVQSRHAWMQKAQAEIQDLTRKMEADIASGNMRAVQVDASIIQGLMARKKMADQQMNQFAVWQGKFVGDSGSGYSRSRSEAVPAPDNHHELLLGVDDPVGDKRDKDGCQFILIQSAINPEQTGAIKYGDDVRFISLFSGAGLPNESGLVNSDPRIWWAHFPSRWPVTAEGKGHGEIFVSVPTFAATQTDAAHFEFVSASGATGEIQDTDIVSIKSLASDPNLKDAFVWINPDSRWKVGPKLDFFKGFSPSRGFHELLIGATPGDNRPNVQNKFRIQQIDSANLGLARDAYVRFITNQEYAPYSKYMETEHRPGTASFIYTPEFHTPGQVLFADNWHLGEKGNGYVTFKAKAKNDIYVVFATNDKKIMIDQGRVKGSDYRLVIGGGDNMYHDLRKCIGNTLISGKLAPDNALGIPFIDGNVDPDSMIKADEWTDYWFSLDNNGVLTFGIGAQVGVNALMTWKDSKQPLKHVYYVGFGGLDKDVEFKDIQFSTVSIDTPEEVAALRGKLNAEKAALVAEEALLIKEEKASADKAATFVVQGHIEQPSEKVVPVKVVSVTAPVVPVVAPTPVVVEPAVKVAIEPVAKVVAKPVAKKAVAGKKVATKKAPAKKAVAKKSAAKKPAAGKKVATKKAPATKTVATKPATTKSVATKPAVAKKPVAAKKPVTAKKKTKQVVKKTVKKAPVAQPVAAPVETAPATAMAEMPLASDAAPVQELI